MVQVRVRMLVRVRVLLRFGGVPSKRRIVRVGSMIVIIGGVGTIIAPIVEGVGGIIVQDGGVGGGGSVLVAAGGRGQVGSNEAGEVATRGGEKERKGAGVGGGRGHGDGCQTSEMRQQARDRAREESPGLFLSVRGATDSQLATALASRPSHRQRP